MALRHVAWLKFKDGVSPERIEDHLAACRLLVSRPGAREPGVRTESHGPRRGFTHCIIVSLPDRDALPAYLDHPEHAPVAEALVADVAELRVMDVEV
jgi:hypothetical protein